MKTSLLLLLTLFCADVAAEDIYSVYLVRHAEKDLTDPDTKDPKLTSCGEERANRLSTIFKDVDLQAVYSTDFKRTQDTAKPTAVSKGLPISLYNPYELDNVINELVSEKKGVLVVGHSNTTNVLAGKLAGTDLEAIDEKEYDRLYHVVVTEDSAKLQLLHQAFKCAK